jgi:hypothetical protein
MNDFKATPECWEWQEKWASKEVPDEDSSCFLELRARVAKLEARANHFGDINKMVLPLVADPAPVVGGLVDRVARAVTLGSNPNICVNIWSDIAARTAILEVARWLRSHDINGSAKVLEQEAGR